MLLPKACFALVCFSTDFLLISDHVQSGLMRSRIFVVSSLPLQIPIKVLHFPLFWAVTETIWNNASSGIASNVYMFFNQITLATDNYFKSWYLDGLEIPFSLWNQSSKPDKRRQLNPIYTFISYPIFLWVLISSCLSLRSSLFREYFQTKTRTFFYYFPHTEYISFLSNFPDFIFTLYYM